MLSYRIMEVWGLLLTPWVVPCQGWTCKLNIRYKYDSLSVSPCRLISAFAVSSKSFLYFFSLHTIFNFPWLSFSLFFSLYSSLDSSFLFCLRGPGGRGPWPGPNANSVSQKPLTFTHDRTLVVGKDGGKQPSSSMQSCTTAQQNTHVTLMTFNFGFAAQRGVDCAIYFYRVETTPSCCSLNISKLFLDFIGSVSLILSTLYKFTFSILWPSDLIICFFSSPCR